MSSTATPLRAFTAPPSAPPRARLSLRLNRFRLAWLCSALALERAAAHLYEVDLLNTAWRLAQDGFPITALQWQRVAEDARRRRLQEAAFRLRGPLLTAEMLASVLVGLALLILATAAHAADRYEPLPLDMYKVPADRSAAVSPPGRDWRCTPNVQSGQYECAWITPVRRWVLVGPHMHVAPEFYSQTACQRALEHVKVLSSHKVLCIMDAP